MAGADMQNGTTRPTPHLRAEYPRIRRFLQASDNQAAADAILEALPTVGPEVAGLLVKVLLDRGQQRGLLGLVRIFHLLPDSQQRRLVGSADRLSGALRAAMAEPGSQQRINAVSLIRAAPGDRDAYLLATAMCDATEAVSEAAAEALTARVSDYIEEQSHCVSTEKPANPEVVGWPTEHPSVPGDASPGRAPYLLEAVRQALAAYPIHRANGVVEAAMQLAGCSRANFETLFGDPPPRIFRAALDVFRSSSDPAFAGFAWRALSSERWRESVARAIGDRVRPAFLVGMIRLVHRLGEAGAGGRLRPIRQLAWLRNGAAPLLSLPPELMESAVRFLISLGLPVATKADLMRELILTGPASAQIPALKATIREGYDPTGRLLRMVAGWGDPALSPMAQRALPLPQDFALPGTLSVGSPPAWSAAMSKPGGFDTFWEQFGRVRPTDRGRMADTVEWPIPRFEENLRSKCRSSKPADRLQAVSVVRGLRLEPRLSVEMVRLARDDDRIVRSAALAALGDAPAAISRRLLLEAVQDHDTRVQANALEALDRLGYDHELASLEHLLEAGNNRVRANLGRTFLRIRPEKGIETLLDMLASPDRSYRISSLWVIQDGGLLAGGPAATELRKGLEARSKTEPDAQIRRRAARVLAGAEAGYGMPESFFFEELSG